MRNAKIAVGLIVGLSLLLSGCGDGFLAGSSDGSNSQTASVPQELQPYSQAADESAKVTQAMSDLASQKYPPSLPIPGLTKISQNSLSSKIRSQAVADDPVYNMYIAKLKDCIFTKAEISTDSVIVVDILAPCAITGRVTINLSMALAALNADPEAGPFSSPFDVDISGHHEINDAELLNLVSYRAVQTTATVHYGVGSLSGTTFNIPVSHKGTSIFTTKSSATITAVADVSGNVFLGAASSGANESGTLSIDGKVYQYSGKYTTDATNTVETLEVYLDGQRIKFGQLIF